MSFGRTGNINDVDSSDHISTSIADASIIIKSSKDVVGSDNCALITTDDAEECPEH